MRLPGEIMANSSVLITCLNKQIRRSKDFINRSMALFVQHQLLKKISNGISVTPPETLNIDFDLVNKIFE